MTREDAINIMKVIVHMLEEKYDTERVEDAVNMAIKSLEQEPCEDCISRKTVRQALDKYIQKAQSNGTKDDLISFEELVIKNLPSVQPKAKTGHWIEVIDEIDSLGNKTWHHECSICGNTDSGWGKDNYCPNCGAKMQEVKE